MDGSRQKRPDGPARKRNDVDTVIDAINGANRAQGTRVSILRQGNALSAQAQWKVTGEVSPKQRKLSLGLKATPSGIREADKQAKAIWSAIQIGEDPKKAITSKTAQAKQTTASRLTVGIALTEFEKTYFEERRRTASTETSFKRLKTELNRLPREAVLSAELLVDTTKRLTKPDTRSRLECVMAFKRLAKQFAIETTSELDRLRGNYSSDGPKGRDIPNDEKLLEFLQLVRPTTYGWCICAMAIYGLRPGEVPSLVLKKDGFGSSLNTKLKRSLPAERDVMALPKSWVEKLDMHNIYIPGNQRWIKPQEYDSGAARKFVNNWIQWWNRSPKYLSKAKSIMPNFQNYDLRHAWALRAINFQINTNISAKLMGHSEETHIKHYERWIKKDELLDAMRKLDRG